MSAPGEKIRFAIDRRGEFVFALAPGIDRRHLVRLKRGEWEIDRELDLHGEDRKGARAAVRGAVQAARDAGERCVRIVHGRGLRSADGAVLREALPGWLAEAPLGSWVMAFASAPSDLGGSGATLVLLRRVRP